MPDHLTRKAHALFMQAIDLDDAARRAFVESQCNDDQTLCGKVMALLHAVNQTRDFLEAPAFGSLSGGTTLEQEIDASLEIPRYCIVGLIGQGGMACVYEAIQERPHRRVALKVMNRAMTKTSALQRFEFETEVLARLRHPHIAQIYEASSIEDGVGCSIPYFAMEYIENARSITAYANAQSLDLPKRLALFALVCDAVQHGHQNGVIHRDLKPGNVLVDSQGQLKVIDFGIARSTDPDKAWITAHGDSGHLIGTLNYMSPEQCAGSIDLDVRTDVYSLGMILYELLCGRLPHDLTQVPLPEALHKVQHEPPPRPSSINPVLHGDLDAIILKAIDKDPDRRYRTAADLGADLKRFLRHETIEARPPTLMYQTRMFARRHRPLVISLAAVAVIMVLATVLSTWFAYRAAEELRLRRSTEREALAQRDAAVWRAYVASMAAASAGTRSGELQYARWNLMQGPEIHRNWEWRFLHQATEQSTHVVRAHDDIVFAFDASRDGSCLATGSRDHSIHLWDAATRSILNVAEGHVDWVLSVAFNHDGTLLASGSVDDTVRVWDAKTGQQRHLLGSHPHNVEVVSFGANNRLASASFDGTAYLWDGDSGKQIGQISDQPGGITGVTFSRSGNHLLTWNRRGVLWVRNADATQVLHELSFPGEIFCAAASHDDQLIAAGGTGGHTIIWNLQTGMLVHALQTQDSVSSVRSLAFTPDNNTLATGFSDRIIRLWSVQTGEEQLRRMQGHEETVSGLAFSPDGRQLISASWDRTMRVWDYAGPGRIELVTTLRGHQNNVISTRFSPDGSMVASSSSDGTVRLWDSELGINLGVLRGHNLSVFALAFSPDGKRIASGSHDQTVRIWDATTGQVQTVLRGHTGHVWSVAFSPDGQFLASAGNDMVIRIWDLATEKTIATLEGHSNRVTCIAFSPDGTQLASASRDHSVRLWNIATQTAVFAESEHRLDVWAVEFNAAGTRLYSGSRDQTVRVWDTATGNCLDVLDGHGQVVTSLSLNPAGDRLVAGSWYGEIVVWDVNTHDVVLSFKGHDQVIRSVDFSPCGHRLASASYDGTVRIFDDAPREVRLQRRTQLKANDEAASATVDRLFKEYLTPAKVAAALETAGQCEERLLSSARKLILLRANDSATSPNTQ